MGPRSQPGPFQHSMADNLLGSGRSGRLTRTQGFAQQFLSARDLSFLSSPRLLLVRRPGSKSMNQQTSPTTWDAGRGTMVVRQERIGRCLGSLFDINKFPSRATLPVDRQLVNFPPLFDLLMKPRQCHTSTLLLFKPSFGRPDEVARGEYGIPVPSERMDRES
jgi:hypothetical protein